MNEFEALEKSKARHNKGVGMKKDILPSWYEIDEKKNRGEELDPIELFIYENEPACSDEKTPEKADEKFRRMLIEAFYFWSGK